MTEETSDDNKSDRWDSSNDTLSFDPHSSKGTLDESTSSELSASRRHKPRKSKRDPDKKTSRRTKKGAEGKKKAKAEESSKTAAQTGSSDDDDQIKTSPKSETQKNIDDESKKTSEGDFGGDSNLPKESSQESADEKALTLTDDEEPAVAESLPQHNATPESSKVESAEDPSQIGIDQIQKEDAKVETIPETREKSVSPPSDKPSTLSSGAANIAVENISLDSLGSERKDPENPSESAEKSERSELDQKTSQETETDHDDEADSITNSENVTSPLHQARKNPKDTITSEGTGSTIKMRGKKSSFSEEIGAIDGDNGQELPTIAETHESSGEAPDGSTRTGTLSHKLSTISGLTNTSSANHRHDGSPSTLSQSQKRSEMSTITGTNGTADALDLLNQRYETRRKTKGDIGDDTSHTLDGRSIDEMTMTDISVVTLDPALDYANKTNPFNTLTAQNRRVHDASPLPPPRTPNVSNVISRTYSAISEDLTLDLTLDEEEDKEGNGDVNETNNEKTPSPRRERQNAFMRNIVPASPLLKPGYSLLVGRASKDPELRRRNARSQSRERPKRSNSTDRPRARSKSNERTRASSRERRKNDEPTTPLRRVSKNTLTVEDGTPIITPLRRLSKNTLAAAQEEARAHVKTPLRRVSKNTLVTENEASEQEGVDQSEDFIMVPMEPKDFSSPRLRTPSPPPTDGRSALKDFAPMSARRAASPSEEMTGRRTGRSRSPGSRRALLGRQLSAPHLASSSSRGKRHSTIDSKLNSESRTPKKSGGSAKSLGDKLAADEEKRPRRSRGSRSVTSRHSVDASKRKKDREMKEVEKRLAASLSRLQQSIAKFEDSGSSLSAFNESNSQLHQSLPLFSPRFDQSPSGSPGLDERPKVPRSKKSLEEKLAIDGKEKKKGSRSVGSKSRKSGKSSGEKRRKHRKSRSIGLGEELSNLNLSGDVEAHKGAPDSTKTKLEAKAALQNSNRKLETRATSDGSEGADAVVSSPSTGSKSSLKIVHPSKPGSVGSLGSGGSGRSGGAKSRSSSRRTKAKDSSHATTSETEKPTSYSTLDPNSVEDDSSQNSDIDSQASPTGSLHEKLKKGEGTSVSGTPPSLVEISLATSAEGGVAAASKSKLHSQLPPRSPDSARNKLQIDGPKAKSRWAGLRKSMQFISAVKAKGESKGPARRAARQQAVEETAQDEGMNSMASPPAPKMPLDLSQIEGTPHIEIVDGKRRLVIELDDE
jgi:hypothetical protein